METEQDELERMSVYDMTHEELVKYLVGTGLGFDKNYIRFFAESRLCNLAFQLRDCGFTRGRKLDNYTSLNRFNDIVEYNLRTIKRS